jgi:hypothetical protein
MSNILREGLFWSPLNGFALGRYSARTEPRYRRQVGWGTARPRAALNREPASEDDRGGAYGYASCGLGRKVVDHHAATTNVDPSGRAVDLPLGTAGCQ